MTDDVELTLAQHILASRVLSTRWDSRAQWEAWALETGLLVADEDGNLSDGPRVQNVYLNGPSGFEVDAGVYDQRWHVDTLIETGAVPDIVAGFISFLEANGVAMAAEERNNLEDGLSVGAIGGTALDPRTFSSRTHRFLGW